MKFLYLCSQNKHISLIFERILNNKHGHEFRSDSSFLSVM